MRHRNSLRQSMTLTPMFHPAVARWFERGFAAPTEAQAAAWPAIKEGSHVLIAAPTGSGKTLAAFLAAIDGLVRQGIESGLPDETQVVYVSRSEEHTSELQSRQYLVCRLLLAKKQDLNRLCKCL